MLFKKGKEHPNWKGGYISIFNVRGSYKYRLWRSDVLTRDNFICQRCGKKNNLHVHHIDSFNDIVKEHSIKTIEDILSCEPLWNINNGLTLCEVCHKTLHKAISEGRAWYEQVFI